MQWRNSSSHGNLCRSLMTSIDGESNLYPMIFHTARSTETLIFHPSRFCSTLLSVSRNCLPTSRSTPSNMSQGGMNDLSQGSHRSMIIEDNYSSCPWSKSLVLHQKSSANQLKGLHKFSLQSCYQIEYLIMGQRAWNFPLGPLK